MSSFDGKTNLRGLLQCEPQIDGDLPMGNFAIFNVAARFDYLEPPQVMHRLSGFLERSPYRLVAPRRGSARDLNSLEYFSFHDFPPGTCGECKFTPFGRIFDRLVATIIRHFGVGYDNAESSMKYGLHRLIAAQRANIGHNLGAYPPRTSRSA
jgi:hypothetical protein